MESVISFVDAVALPATIIFLTLHFQEVIQKRLSGDTGPDHRMVDVSAADTQWPGGSMLIDSARARMCFQNIAADDPSDQQIAQRIAECLVPAAEVYLLSVLVAAGGESELDDRNGRFDEGSLQSLIVKGYVSPGRNNRYVLTQDGCRLFQDRLERISTNRQSGARGGREM